MKKLLLCLTALSSAFTLTAQEDAPGSKDHPMLSRMPGFYIYEYTSNFNSHVFPDGSGNEQAGKNLEGTLTRIEYRFKPESGVKFPSCLQVMRNYSNAVTKLGGKKVAENAVVGDNMWYCGWIEKDGKEVWVHAGEFLNDENGNGGEGMAYVLYVMEIEAMKQEVTATDIFDALKTQGFISLDIRFETGKSTIQPASLTIIDQIAQMLTTHPDMKVSIEGHTDNTGDAVSNKKLSEERAKAVMDALIAKGVSSSRLSSQGWGQEKPVADNRTEDGRAKNRRVEIIKK